MSPITHPLGFNKRGLENFQKKKKKKKEGNFVILSILQEYRG
jgi:hypothetical protein